MKGTALAGIAKSGRRLALALAASLLAASLAAEVPVKITYQGNLRQNGNLVTGQRNIVFRIYDSSTSAVILWTSPSYSVTLSTGVFKVDLQPSLTDWNSGSLWLELDIEGSRLSPRDELTAAPYAVNALLHSGKKYSTALTAPASPALGDMWMDSSSNVLKYWNGATWIVSGAGVPMGDDLGNHRAIQDAGHGLVRPGARKLGQFPR